METVLKGWAWLGQDRPGLPESWLNFFDGQSLPYVSSCQDEVFLLFADGISAQELPPTDTTLLERMAWALLCQPGLATVIQPLRRSSHGFQPVLASALDLAALNAIGESGYVMLTRNLGLTSVGPRSTEAWQQLVISADTVAVLPRALLAEKNNPIEFSQLAKSAWRSAHQNADDPWLGLRRAWSPEISNAQVAVRPQPEDGRITVWFAVHWLELGGAEKFAINLVRALRKDRYRIVVSTDVPSANTWLGQLAGQVDEILFLPEFLTEPMFKVFAVHFIASRNIQLIHIHHAPLIYAGLLHIRRFFPDIKILHTLHILELPPDPGGYPELALKHYGAYIDHHHVISHYLADFLKQRWSVTDQHLDIVYLNVDVGHFNPAAVKTGTIRAKHGIPDDACLVGFIGRLTRQKQPLAFVAMAVSLHQRWLLSGNSQALHFLVAGSGNMLAEVEAAIGQAGLSQIMHLHGEVADARPVYADCDIMVLPSENEGLALVCYESMAMAKPILCTDVGAQRELVPKQLLVADGPGVAERLAAKVWALYADAQLRQQIGERCREHVLRYHNETETWQAMHNLYGRLLGLETARLHQPEMPKASGWDLAVLGTQISNPNRLPVSAAVLSNPKSAGLTELLNLLDTLQIPGFVVGRGSADGIPCMGSGQFSSVTVLESPDESGVAAGFNSAIQSALNVNSEYILLVDSDILPSQDCIGQLSQFLDDFQEYAFVAPAIYRKGSDLIVDAGGWVDYSHPIPIRTSLQLHGQALLPPCLKVDFASTSCVLVRTEAIRKAGLLDAKLYSIYYDLDWCLRLQQATGQYGACVPAAKAFHGKPPEPFSLPQLYYSVRNQLTLCARFAQGECRQQAMYWALHRPIRHLVYAALVGEREVALTLWRALRDACLGHYGEWSDPVAYGQRQKILNQDYFRQANVKRVLIDASNETMALASLAALQGIAGKKFSIDVLCDMDVINDYLTKGLFTQVHGRVPGYVGLRSWWRISRLGFDLIITETTMEPRRPSSLAGRRSAVLRAGQLYEASAPIWLIPIAHIAGYLIARISAIMIRRRFL